MYTTIEAKAQRMAANAKPGYMKHGKDIYTFVFDHKEWTYAVYQNGEWLMNINTKTVAGVKSFLKTWLEN